MKACNYRLRPIKNNFAIGPKEVYIGRRRTYLLIDNGKKQVKRRKSLSESRTFTLYPRWTERSEGWREYGCKIDFRDNKSKSYSSLAVPPILRMYSFGVTPVLFKWTEERSTRTKTTKFCQCSQSIAGILAIRYHLFELGNTVFIDEVIVRLIKILVQKIR